MAAIFLGPSLMFYLRDFGLDSMIRQIWTLYSSLIELVYVNSLNIDCRFSSFKPQKDRIKFANSERPTLDVDKLEANIRKRKSSILSYRGEQDRFEEELKRSALNGNIISISIDIEMPNYEDSWKLGLHFHGTLIPYVEIERRDRRPRHVLNEDIMITLLPCIKKMLLDEIIHISYISPSRELRFLDNFKFWKEQPDSFLLGQSGYLYLYIKFKSLFGFSSRFDFVFDDIPKESFVYSLFQNIGSIFHDKQEHPELFHLIYNEKQVTDFITKCDQRLLHALGIEGARELFKEAPFSTVQWFAAR